MDCKTSLPDGLVAQLVEQIAPRLVESELKAVSMEESVREVVHQIGGAMLEAVLGSLLERLLTKHIHATSASSFELKVVLFVLAVSISQLVSLLK